MITKVYIYLFVFAVFTLEFVFAESLKSISISEIVFFGVHPVKELKKLTDLKGRQICIKKYFDTISPKSYIRLNNSPSGTESAVNSRKLNLLEQIVTIMGEKTRDEAKDFAFAVPLHIEWEGMSEGPLAEADFVDKWISKHPNAKITTFLYLFKAHRLRAGFEAALSEGNKHISSILASKYRESLDNARSSTNQLILCIAKDMEEQEYVYLEGKGRP
ncbi:MAG: hypothetical protein HQK79_03895 [Desulfobacterales bacterium]|nr:hypothetical protein [Desulfobacterales bacterium]